VISYFILYVPAPKLIGLKLVALISLTVKLPPWGLTLLLNVKPDSFVQYAFWIPLNCISGAE
jgi:hypothetical protein